MTATKLEETIGQVAADVQEIKRAALPRGEAEDRFKKVEETVEQIQKMLREEVDRKNMEPAGETSGAGAWFARRGIKSMAAIPQHQNARIYKETRNGQVVDELTAPEEAYEAMKVMDHLHIIDTLCCLTRGAGRGSEWVEQKRQKGFQAYLDRFPAVAIPHLETMKEFLKIQGKTLTSTTATTGDEWVPTLWSSQLLDEIRLANPEVNLIPHVPQPSNPWRYPLLSGVGTAYRKIENVNAVASDLTTGQRDWEAHTLSVYQAFADEMDDDSIVAVAPTVRGAIIRAMAEGMGEMLVNGDNNASGHFDNDYQTATAPYRTYQGGSNGLRQFCLDSQGTGTDSTFDGGGNFIGFQDVGDAASQMLKFGAGRLATGEVVLLVNAESWMKLLVEASSPVVTVDKYGSRATILTGEVARIFGIPIFVSFGVEQRRNAVTTSGQNVSGGSNTLSTAVLFNRMNWKIGDRRDFRLEQDRDIVAGRTDLVGTTRMSLNTVEGDVGDANWDPSGTPAAVCIVNIN